MSDIVSPLLQWLNANPELAGLVTFVISAAESVAIIGTIVPGSVTMTAIGTLAGAGVIPLYATIVWAMLGAIVGDSISYWLGHYFKAGLRTIWPFRNNPGVLERGEKFVLRYGVMSVFIGRFVGPVRALVPLVAGMLGMKPLQFTIANVTSAIGWAPAYMLPGILLGAASQELPPDIAVHVILVLFLLFLFGVLCFWITFKLLQLAHQQTNQLLIWIWDSLKRSRYFHVATNLLKHHDPRQLHGQLTLAFYFLITCLVLFCLACYVKEMGPSNMMANETVYHLFRGIRSTSTDNIMINITLLGQKQVILPVVLILFAWLLYKKRARTAFHILALGVLAVGSVFVIKNLVQVTRPWGILNSGILNSGSLNSTDTFSFPSGHTTLATTIYVGTAILIASAMHKCRWLVYIPALLIALMVGISRLYLGAHWFTDVLGAWLLSTAILMVVTLSYHRYKENPINKRSITLIAIISLCLSYGFYHYRYFSTLQTTYTQLPWPTDSVKFKTWWEKDINLPTLRVSLFGLPSQRINVEWIGSLEDIRNTLTKEGWETPPARDFISTLHRIADIQSSEYLPLVSPQYLDERPVIIVSKYTNNGKRLLVLRLWASNRLIKETNTPLWVGTIGFTPRSYSWLFRKTQKEFRVDKIALFPSKNAVWETKIITLFQLNGNKTPSEQNILLIRKK